MALNQVNIMGRVVRDMELRSTKGGSHVTSFTLAVDEDMKNKETGERETDFIDCVAFGYTAEFAAKHFPKGTMMVVVGRLKARTYKDKDGNTRKSTEVRASNVYFAESKKTVGNPSAMAVGYGYETDPPGDWMEVEDEGDLPF